MSASRLVRWLPPALGAALALVGVGALGVASQGLTLTLAPPPVPSTEVDPLVLLRADQAATADEVRQLGRSLEELAAALEAATAADGEARAQGLDRLTARLERRFDALDARAHASRSDDVAPVSSATPGDAPGIAEGAAGGGVDEPAPPAAAPAARGVFTFRAARLDLDARQRFEVIPALSRVGFDAKSTLHDFSGVTSDVSGWIEARLADPGRDAAGHVQARAATLRTGVDGRDEEMRKRFEVERHPDLRFDWTGFSLEHLDRGATKLRGHAEGTLTVHGVARPLRVPVQVEVDAQRRLVVTGEAPVLMSQHGIEAPDMGVIRVEDQVKVWFALRLRALGRAREP